MSVHVHYARVVVFAFRALSIPLPCIVAAHLHCMRIALQLFGILDGHGDLKERYRAAEKIILLVFSAAARGTLRLIGWCVI